MHTRTRAVGLLAAVAAMGAALIAAPVQAAGDRNHDRISDRWEKRHGLSLERNQAKRDQDRDGLENLGEFEARLDPRDGDSDDDGIHDGDEGAGTIASFDPATGALVIDAFAGPDLLGSVDADTEIECEGEDHDGDDHDGDDNSGPSDDSGPGGRAARSGDHSGDDDENCGVQALVPGTVVSEAELRLTQGGATFEKVELR